MDINAPQIVFDYFDAKSVADHEARTQCFADDAVVHDDGQTYNGIDAIRSWVDTAASGFTYTTDVIGSESLPADGDIENYLVVAHLHGNFPGSPVDLKHRFSIRKDLIAELEIAP